MIHSAIKKRQIERIEKNTSGVIIADTEYKHLLDHWIEFTKDIQNDRLQALQNREIETRRTNEVISEVQRNLFTRLSKRRVSEDITLEEDSSSSIKNKRRKREDEQYKEIALLNNGLQTALSSFGDSFGGRIERALEKVTDPVRNMNQKIDNIQQQMNLILASLEALRRSQGLQ